LYHRHAGKGKKTYGSSQGNHIKKRLKKRGKKHCPEITLEDIIELPNDRFDSYRIVHP
jgi:hypothetical protein